MNGTSTGKKYRLRKIFLKIVEKFSSGQLEKPNGLKV